MSTSEGSPGFMPAKRDESTITREEVIKRLFVHNKNAHDSFMKSRRIYAFLAAIPLYIIAVAAIYLEPLLGNYSRSLGAACSLLSLFFIGLFYLQHGFSAPPGPPHYGTERLRKEKSNDSEVSSNATIDAGLPKGSKNALRNAPWYLLDTEDVISYRFDESRGRLLDQISSLNRRANINLMLGVLISLCGMYILGDYIVHVAYASKIVDITEYQKMSFGSKLEAYFLEALPRIAFTLVIELFAFFFLKLYKSTLFEVKYFQNEITNIESSQYAIRLALHEDATEEIVAAVVKGLIETERNHILEKGQTTTELEMARLDTQSVNDTLKTLTTAVEALAKGKGK